MPRLSWFLVFAIVFQLCLGSAWARPVAASGELAAGVAVVAAMPGMPAHCHEAMPLPEQVPGAGGCCCGAAHCHLCSAVGLPLLALVLPVLPRVPNISPLACALVSWTHPPELRPPI